MTRKSASAELPAATGRPELPELPEEASRVGSVDEADELEKDDGDTIVLDRSLWDLEERYRRIAEASGAARSSASTAVRRVEGRPRSGARSGR